MKSFNNTLRNKFRNLDHKIGDQIVERYEHIISKESMLYFFQHTIIDDLRTNIRNFLSDNRI